MMLNAVLSLPAIFNPAENAIAPRALHKKTSLRIFACLSYFTFCLIVVFKSRKYIF